MNSTSPCLTRAPSSNCTAMISLSTRGLIATLAIGRHGAERIEPDRDGLLDRLGDVDRHHRAGRRAGACAAAFCDDEPFQKNTPIPARASPAATPTTNVRFFISRCRLRPRGRRPALPHAAVAASDPSPPVLQGPVAHCASGLHVPSNRYQHREPDFASNPFGRSRSRACWLMSPASRETPRIPHAHRHLERQFGQAANRQPDRLARRAGSRTSSACRRPRCVDEAFPREPIEALGYNVAVHGQKTFNGVAILSKFPFDEVTPRLPGDDADDQARFIEAAVSTKTGVLRVASIYLPNGNPTGHRKISIQTQMDGSAY